MKNSMKECFKKLLSTLLAVIVVMSAMPVQSAMADAVIGDQFTIQYKNYGIKYQVTNANSKEVKVIADELQYIGDIIIPPNVTYENITYSVTAIGVSAFYGCLDLTSVVIPSTVSLVDKFAFNNCTSLTNVLFQRIDVPTCALYKETNNITQTTTDIDIFYGCISLNHIYVPKTSATDYKSDGGLAANKDKILGDGFTDDSLNYEISGVGPRQVTVIENGSPNTYSGSITIPSSVYNSDDGSYYSVTEIGTYAFLSCTNLTSIIVPSGVTRINANAFAGCTNLVSITIPNTVASLGDSAFSGCTKLTSVDFPSSLQTVDASAFANSGLTSVTIPAGVTFKGTTFFNCKDLSNVIISPGVTTIYPSDFSQCPKLESITIPSSVTNIAALAFAFSGLKSITIPSSVTNIGDGAFRACASLTKAIFLSTTVPTLPIMYGTPCFKDCGSALTVYVPASALSIYQAQASRVGVASSQMVSSVSIGTQFTSTDNGPAIKYEIISMDPKQIKVIANSNPPTYSGNINIPSSVHYNDDDSDYNVTSIESAAFKGCSGLTDVTIPSSVTSIWSYAFDGTGLTSVTIPASVTSFGEAPFDFCNALKEVIFEGTSLQNLPNVGADELAVFMNCSNLEKVFVPADAVATYRSYAASFGVDLSIIVAGIDVGAQFTDNTIKYEITSLDPKQVKVIANNYSGTVNIPTNVTYSGSSFTVTAIGDGAFNQCMSLNSVSLPETLTAIGSDVFNNCDALTDVTIPSGVTSIGGETFISCNNLAHVTLPEGITSIPYRMFEGCQALEEISIPNSVTTIEYDAFKNCSTLTQVTIPPLVTTIQDEALRGCTGLTQITIPASITSISNSVFEKCTNLSAIDVDSNNPSFSSIDGVVFDKGAANLILCPEGKTGSYTVPSGITAIQMLSFSDCNKLTGITLSAGVSSIAAGAFAGCTSLTDMTFLRATPPQLLGPQIFFDIENPVKGHIVPGSKHNYDTTFFQYASQITFDETAPQSLSVPTNLSWNGTTAKWGTVTDASAYTVTLLKGSTTVSTKNIEAGTTSYDFTDEMKNAGIGDYTFTVIAKGSGSAQDSAASAVSIKHSYSGASEISGGTISSFGLLSSSVKTQNVKYGTEFSSLNLPQKLTAVVDSVSGALVSVIRWVSNVTGAIYDPYTVGTYDIIPVLDSGYELKDSGVKLPHITVTVAAKQESSHHSDSPSSKTSSTTDTTKTQTKVDVSGNTATVETKPDSVTLNGNTAEMAATVSTVTTDTSGTNASLDTGKQSSVVINLPKDAMLQQFAAKKDVNLTITVPSDVARDANTNLAVTINADKEILTAAKDNLSDVTIQIKDADTQQMAYSWTFKGADLAKSTAPMTDINIAMSVHLTTEIPKVNVITPDMKGLVLSFDHSGLLPSVASVKFSALEKGFKPGQTLYFYYYNPTTKQIESLGKDAYTVDFDGYVTVPISHCSDYVLLPNAARSITLDTRTYTMSSKRNYEIGVKLTNASDTIIKAYSSTKGVAEVTVLKNGNVKVTGLKSGLTYIMIDVYDQKNKFLTHTSVRVTVQNSGKLNGNSARQYGIF